MSDGLSKLEREELVATIADDYCDRLGRGESPDIDAIARRHPGLSDIVRRTLGALKAVRSMSVEDLISARDDANSNEPRSVGDFRIIREIGRGGMGVVFEAEQLSLARRVALKVLPFAAVLDPRQLQRFKNEAQAAALLHHENIVPVHGIGSARGVHYYAMQYIEGHTLAEVIRDVRRLEGLDDPIDAATETASPNPSIGMSLASGKFDSHGRPRSSNELSATRTSSPAAVEMTASDTAVEPKAVLSTERSSTRSAYFRSIAELGIHVAEALEHAHCEGVVHRDIKPSNLILDAAGKIWVMDFGLARMESDHGVTMTGDLIGTLRYMSPEQALAKRVVIDHRTDIYSLGVTLYELLTLRLAYADEDRQELIRKIAFEEPKPPRRWNKSIPVELETIVLKAIAKSPHDRFTTAKELAEDLQRFLEDKPIQARRATVMQRITKWSRRHRSVVAAAAAVLVMAVAGLTVSNFLIARQRNAAQANYQKAEKSRKQAVTNFELAETQRRRAEESEEQSRRRLVRLTIVNGMRHLDAGELLSSLPWFTEALSLDHADASRGQLHRIRIRSALSQCPKMAWMWFHEGPVIVQASSLNLKLSTNAEFSPDGRYVVAPSGNMTARVWDTTNGREVHVLRHSEPVLHASFSRDGRRIATACGDLGGGHEGFAVVWDLGTGEQLARFAHDDAVVRAALSPDGERLVTGSWDRTARVWDVRSGEAITDPIKHASQVNAVAFSPDGHSVVTASQDWRIWDSVTAEPLTPPLSQSGSMGVYHASFSPDGSRVVTAGGSAQIWDTASGRLVVTLQNANYVWYAAFSPDGQWVVTASRDETAQVWEAATGDRVGSPLRHLSGVAQAQFSPDSRHVVTSSWDRTARVWEASTGKPITLPLKHGGDVMCAAFSPDGRRIVTASTNLLVRVWDLANLKGISRSLRHSNLESDVRVFATFGPDGQRVVTTGHDGSGRVWDATTCEPVTPPLNHSGAVHRAAFSPDGLYVLTSCADGTARIWDAATGQPKGAALRHGKRPVVHASFSHDGGRVATASDDSTARVWNVRTGEPIATFRHRGPVIVAWFSPDGKRVLTGSADGSAQIWDAANGKLLAPALQHKSALSYASFSPDGHRVLTTSLDGTAQVWDAATGEPIGAPLWHGQAVLHGSFSPDGQRVVTASDDNTARVWEADTGKPHTAPLGWKPNNVVRASFNHDCRLIALACHDGTARVWDADTGEPVTGALRHDNNYVAQAEFSPRGNRLLTACDGTARLWDVLPDDRPVEDLVLLAQVLCGHRIDATGGSLEPVDPAALRDAWQSLRDKYPADFVASPEDLFMWHREEAYDCERLQRWSDAIEHLESAQQYSADPSNHPRYRDTLKWLNRLRAKAEERRERAPADQPPEDDR